MQRTLISASDRTRVRNEAPAAFWLATWFGCGLAPRAPGTAGTLGAIPLFFLLRGTGPLAFLAAAALLLVVGWWAAGSLARRFRSSDPQLVVIDEVVGVLLAWTLVPATWQGMLVGVVLFRIFDITKPPPCKMLERRLPPAWGIMADDVMAGVYAATIAAGARFLNIL